KCACERRTKMIKQFAGASIWSEDLNNLLPFYRDVLGIKVLMESPGFVLLGADSTDSPALGLGTHSEVRDPNADPARHMVGFATDDSRPIGNGLWLLESSSLKNQTPMAI